MAKRVAGVSQIGQNMGNHAMTTGKVLRKSVEGMRGAAKPNSHSHEDEAYDQKYISFHSFLLSNFVEAQFAPLRMTIACAVATAIGM